MTDDEILATASKSGLCLLRHEYLFRDIILDFARAIAQKQCEKDAVCAWNHYMDTCRKHGHGPSVDRIQDFCAADAIREQGD